MKTLCGRHPHLCSEITGELVSVSDDIPAGMAGNEERTERRWKQRGGK